jgi:Holliday junction resolvase-like predicted endonuclease
MREAERSPAGPRGRIGASAERAAAAHLSARGWSILARNVRVGRDELDLIARAPGADAVLVIVEVRARSGPAFGTAVESVDRRKVARLYRAAAVLRRCGHPALGPGPLRRPLRVDLLTMRRRPSGSWDVESHLSGLEPPA